VIYGHHHLNVTDLSAHRKFFVDTLGGHPVAVGPAADAIVAFPNALIVLRQQTPTGGTKGTTVNHFAFGVPDIRAMVDRVKAAGWPMITRAETPPTQEVLDDLAFMVDQQTDVAFTMAPDDTKIEFIEIKSQTAPVALHHIHFLTPQVPEMKAWYVQVLDATPGKRGNFEAADLPGVNLTYSAAPAAVAGTRGRALDHIGFEVSNLLAMCRKLESLGIPLDTMAAHDPSLNVDSAFLTDPWGTYVELTEGLVRLEPGATV
jgi:catechol 2,3-dioxygenase-like lactoylglutathione lyase family enzyme